MAMGSILRFLEEFDVKNSSHSYASLLVIGQHDEFDHLVREFSVQIDGGSIRFGSGEHFAPGPSLIDETLGYDFFWIHRGREPEGFLIDELVSYARLVLENVCRLEGVV